MEYFDLVNKRKSIRKFSDKKVEKEKIDAILELVNKAPSAGNMQSYKIYVTENRELMKKMWEKKQNQTFLLEASYLLVFCADVMQAKGRFGLRGEKLYCLQDATIICTYMQLAAEDLGLASVWVGAFDENSIKEILNLPENINPVAILPIGYAAEDPDSGKRRDVKDIVTYL